MSRDGVLSVSNRAMSGRLNAYVTLIRPPNTIMIGLGVVIGEAIGLGKLPGVREAVFGFLTASLMMAGTMVANDIYDVEIDRVNSPQRPLPSGTVKTREATALAVALSAAAIGFSALLNLWTFLTALLALALMVYYNTRGKKTGLIGNAVVSFNVALPFFYGGLAVNSIRPLLFIFSVVAFLANFGREVAKGIADVKGDSLRQVRTLAVVRGTKVAALASAGLFVTAVLLSFLPPFLETISWLYYPPVIFADVGFLYSAYRLVSNQTPENIRAVKGHVLIWMLLGLVGFLLGGAALL
jgi:geranylgeranylglycerol-phosphate geranylgeranyltransferase